VKRERFEALVLLGHKEAAVEVPFDPANRWSISAAPLRPGRRGHAVRGSLNGTEFESTFVPRSKRFWLLLGDEILRSASASAGDRVKVAIEPAGGASGASSRVNKLERSRRDKKSPRTAITTSRGENGAASAKSRSRRVRDLR
jgi:hypothetical protein